MDYSTMYKGYNLAALNSELRLACEKNNLELVEFLLTNKEKKADIECYNGYPLSAAAAIGSIPLIEFLLNSETLVEKANLTSNFDNCFKVACHNNQIDLINHLIFKQNLEFSKHISTFLNRYKESSIQATIEQAQNWFLSRKSNDLPII
jgi:ankyrin repeat protein